MIVVRGVQSTPITWSAGCRRMGVNMKILAALYIAGILTWFGCWAIRKSDRFFWQGVGWGLLFLILYSVFMLSVIFLVKGHL
jgi:TM2 domain-containing membrane protein YozV